MEETVRPVEAHEEARFEALISLAMCADPITRWAAPDALQYMNAMSPILTAFAGQIAIRNSTADVIGDFDGAACWLPPGAEPDHAAAQELFAKHFGPERLAQVEALFEAQARYHPGEPHWYLWIIGVDPARRGKGLGRKLMSHALERVDRERGLACLEATTERSLRFYSDFGFELLDEISVGGSPTVFPMMRSPR